MGLEDSLGDRMKGYEMAAEGGRLDVRLPVYARIDGRSFSKFTHGLERPFDQRMSRAMIETTKGLVDRTHARIGYTQSDEISLVYLADVWDVHVDKREVLLCQHGSKLRRCDDAISSLAREGHLA